MLELLELRSQGMRPTPRGPAALEPMGLCPEGVRASPPSAPGVRHPGFGTGLLPSAPAQHRWILAVDVMPVSHTLLFREGVSSANSPGCHCWGLIRFLWLCLVFIQTVIQLPEASMCCSALAGASRNPCPTGCGDPILVLGTWAAPQWLLRRDPLHLSVLADAPLPCPHRSPAV